MKIIILLIIVIQCQLVVSQGSVVVYNSDSGESTINGMPFFAKGIYTDYGDALTLNWSAIKDQGFNVVQSYRFRDLDNLGITTFLNNAQTEGVYVLFMIRPSYVKNGDINSIVDTVNTFKNHPALYGWYLVDEPDYQNISAIQVQNAYNAIKNIDNNHPVFISTFDLDTYYAGTDVDMHQFYSGRTDFMKDVFLNNANGNQPTKGYLSLINENTTNTSWLAIINLHSTRFNRPRGLLEDQDAGTSISPAEFWHSTSTLTENQRINRGNDIKNNYVSQNIIPYGNFPLASNAGGIYRANSNFPKNVEIIRGQVASVLVYGSNAIFGWLWDNKAFNTPPSINSRWGYYTIFHHHPTKYSLKDVFLELSQFENMLISNKEEDVRSTKGDMTYRYIKSNFQELIIAVNEREDGTELNASLTALDLPINASVNGYSRLSGNSIISGDIDSFILTPRGAAFFYKNNTLNMSDLSFEDMWAFSLIPNPASNAFKIKGGLNADIKVFDVKGMFLFGIKNYNGGFIPTDKLRTGVYLVHIIVNEEHSKILKLVID